MFLDESEEAYGESQIPCTHPNLSCGASHVWGGGPVCLPLLRPPYEARYTRKAIGDSEKGVQPVDQRIYGHKDENHEGESIESHLNWITDADEGGLPQNRIDEASSVGERRGQQKRIYQLHTREGVRSV